MSNQTIPSCAHRARRTYRLTWFMTGFCLGVFAVSVGVVAGQLQTQIWSLECNIADQYADGSAWLTCRELPRRVGP